MALPSSGEITLKDIYEEYHKENYSSGKIEIADYGQKYDITNIGNEIKISDFYGTSVVAVEIGKWWDPTEDSHNTSNSGDGDGFGDVEIKIDPSIVGYNTGSVFLYYSFFSFDIDVSLAESENFTFAYNDGTGEISLISETLPSGESVISINDVSTFIELNSTSKVNDIQFIFRFTINNIFENNQHIKLNTPFTFNIHDVNYPNSNTNRSNLNTDKNSLRINDLAKIIDGEGNVKVEWNVSFPI